MSVPYNQLRSVAGSHIHPRLHRRTRPWAWPDLQKAASGLHLQMPGVAGAWFFRLSFHEDRGSAAASSHSPCRSRAGSGGLYSTLLQTMHRTGKMGMHRDVRKKYSYQNRGISCPGQRIPLFFHRCTGYSTGNDNLLILQLFYEPAPGNCSILHTDCIQTAGNQSSK